jgi:hypothetical protein
MVRNCFRLCLAAVAVLFGFATAADEKKEAPPKAANVFTHAEKLTSQDKLTDGEKGAAIEIKEDTVLVWVDLMPGARFSHPTEYVLVSASGTRVVKGDWWPVLNGKPLFRGESKVEPVKLGGKDGERK